MNKSTIFFTSFVLIVFAGIMTAGAVTVSLDNPTTDTSKGKTFEVKVQINPEGASIAGVQLDIRYDKKSIMINNIKEGNFLTQNGTNTIFNSGSIDNSLGKALNIYGAILGRTSVQTPGTFIILNFSSLNSKNNPRINLENVIVVDPDGNQVYPVPAATLAVKSQSSDLNQMYYDLNYYMSKYIIWCAPFSNPPFNIMLLSVPSLYNSISSNRKVP